MNHEIHEKYENGCLRWAFRGLKSSTRLVAPLLIVAQLAFIVGCSRGVKWLDQQDLSEPLMQRAFARKNEGNIDSAVRLYAEALDNDPKLARAHLDIALLLHDYGKDYVRAIYHYQRYLELRPRTEKREMIENRIRLAGQLFGASVFPRDRAGAGRVGALEKENDDLKHQVEELSRQLDQARATAAQTTDGGPDFTQAATSGKQRARLRSGSDAGQAAGQKVIRTYRVKRGDTLSSIAAELYKDPSKWEKIYKANRDSLANSSKLKVGQVLVIP